MVETVESLGEPNETAMIEKISIENVDRAKVFNLGGFTVAGHKAWLESVFDSTPRRGKESAA